jgi:hypothetical protein
MPGQIHDFLLRWLPILLVQALMMNATALPAAEPKNKSECMESIQQPLQDQCRKLIAQAGNSTVAQCLAAIGAQVELVCEQFFGAGKDFCAVCTSGCTSNFQPNTGQRTSCLQMCMRQPGCQ